MFLLVHWLYCLMLLVYDEREHINHFMYSSNDQNYNIYRKKIININKSHQCWWDLIPSVVLNWQKQSGALDIYLYYKAIWTKIRAWWENLTSSISTCHRYTMNPQGTLTYLATSAKWHACMFSVVQRRRR